MVIVLAGFRTVKVRFCYLIVRILSKYFCIILEKSEFCFSTDDLVCTSTKIRQICNGLQIWRI